jgi:hypothetical protein
VFPVRYELNLYILFRRISSLKSLNIVEFKISVSYVAVRLPGGAEIFLFSSAFRPALPFGREGYLKTFSIETIHRRMEGRQTNNDLVSIWNQAVLT